MSCGLPPFLSYFRFLHVPTPVCLSDLLVRTVFCFYLGLLPPLLYSLLFWDGRCLAMEAPPLIFSLLTGAKRRVYCLQFAAGLIRLNRSQHCCCLMVLISRLPGWLPGSLNLRCRHFGRQRTMAAIAIATAQLNDWMTVLSHFWCLSWCLLIEPFTVCVCVLADCFALWRPCQCKLAANAAATEVFCLDEIVLMMVGLLQ